MTTLNAEADAGTSVRTGRNLTARVARAIGGLAADLPALALFIVLVVLPLLAVLAQAVLPDLFDPVSARVAFDAAPLARAFASPRVMRSILHSLELGAAVAVTATALGASFAILVQRVHLPLRPLIAPVPWLVFLTPAYLKALAWVLMMSPGGYLAQLGLLPAGASDAFFGFGGLVFVHTLSLFPLPAFIVGGALAGFGGELEEAARLTGAGPLRIWLGINLPLLVPALALSAIAVFAEVLSDFGLAATIAKTAGFGVLTYGIYAAASDYPVDFPLAGAQALVLMSIILAVTFADRLLRRGDSARLISGRNRAARLLVTATPLRWSFGAAALAVAVLALWLPLAAILLRTVTATLGHGLEVTNFTFENLAGALSPGAPATSALLRSLLYATVAATLAAAAGLVLAMRLDRASAAVRAGVTGIALGTIAIPGIVLGFGYILVWNRLPGFRDWPFPHYGQASLLVTGYVATALPYALILILTAVGQLAPNLADAARLFGVGAVRRLVRIVLPLVLLSVLTAFLLTFIRTVFELPVSQLLIPQTGSPVPPYVVRLLSHDDDGPAAALALVSMVVAGGIAGLLWTLARRRLTFGRAVEASP